MASAKALPGAIAPGWARTESGLYIPGPALDAMAEGIRLWLDDGQSRSDYILRIPANPAPGGLK